MESLELTQSGGTVVFDSVSAALVDQSPGDIPLLKESTCAPPIPSADRWFVHCHQSRLCAVGPRPRPSRDGTFRAAIYYQKDQHRKDDPQSVQEAAKELARIFRTMTGDEARQRHSDQAPGSGA